MAEQMNEMQIMSQEKNSTGTAWTRNEDFDKNGYLVVKDLWNAEELYHPVPEIRGQLHYWDKNPEHFNHNEVEGQVDGSLARYWHPQYRAIHSGIRMKLEEIIGRKLSFSIQLSHPDDYEGGNVQLLDEAGNSYIAPRKRGAIVLFDSRTQHRVLKVTKGTRKSIVGWVVGPRWK